MARHYGEPTYVYYYPDPRFDRDGRQLHELAPVTFREQPYYNDVYYQRHRYYPGPRIDRDGRQLQELAPVPFQEQPFYDDEDYRRDFRHHHPDAGYGGHVIPHSEQVYLRTEDGDVSWWHHVDHLHGAYPYPVYVVERQQPAEPVQTTTTTTTTVELYVPQLCCDSCERRVVEKLTDMAGVENVTADQWTKKVTVMGVNLHPESLLYHLHHVHDLRMNRSVLWQDRRS